MPGLSSVACSEKFGQFCPSGMSIYFLSNDGVRLLLATFCSPRQAVEAAIFFNKVICPSEGDCSENNSGIEL